MEDGAAEHDPTACGDGEGSAQGVPAGERAGEQLVSRTVADAAQQRWGGELTNEEVKTKAEDLTKYWQRQLRLEDWDITIVVPEHDPRCYAEIVHHVGHGTAKITLRNPAICPPDLAGNPDLEISLVHELLHLRFAFVGIKKETPEEDLHELGIERTAQALVLLNRGERR
jgi:hypothetical protein